jgi:hypothetical protein
MSSLYYFFRIISDIIDEIINHRDETITITRIVSYLVASHPVVEIEVEGKVATSKFSMSEVV